MKPASIAPLLWFRAAILATAAFSLPTLADVIPPQAAEAAKRLAQNPNAFDRADQYCKDKKVGNACSIPGNPFAGGGEGICRNELNRNSSTIDLNCERATSPIIERGLPSGGFLADDTLCSAYATDTYSNGIPIKKTLPMSELTCTPGPVLKDRFCADKENGAACTVELQSGGKKQEFPGVCKQEVESISLYFQGRRKASRMVLACQPPDDLPPRTYTPATWWQKLTQ
ncbi:hypothetical protein [Herbaspirillum sp.]|uniref:hypothetical protein n=1 Tax=Herbaspirillum sp. TaxID=1890675 RepID=UPI001B246A9B|nr:hypothetical protein [Herbaspirillum sp.]MBO9538078.1 hypothetical protein [Herbaspirillum sp.]